MKVMKNIVLAIAMITLMAGCGGSTEPKTTSSPSSSGKTISTNPNDPMSNKGIGPVKEVVLGELNPAMVAEGEEIYTKMCSACHKPAEKFIGPAPKGILSRRSPEWVMNMILNPVEMVKSDPIAKQLLIESNLAPMANQNLTEDQARKILEYFRTL
jgi:mono/diheme cytochrome c family protein